jgi:hypothetical protein
MYRSHRPTAADAWLIQYPMTVFGNGRSQTYLRRRCRLRTFRAAGENPATTQCSSRMNRRSISVQLIRHYRKLRRLIQLDIEHHTIDNSVDTKNRVIPKNSEHVNNR